MYDLKCLIKRNILIFLRDKTAVFFSFLSVMILLALYFLFIGRQFTSGSDFDGMSSNLKTYLSTSVIMGGVLVINTVSLALGVMGNIITDMEYKILDGFLVTPVRRQKIVISYYISSIIVTATLTLMMWFITVIYVGLASTYWYSFGTILKVSGLIVFYTLISATLMIFLVTRLKSVNAFGTLSGVLGTLIGFMSGIYMPLIVLGQSMAYVASLVPFTHMTILLKQAILAGPYQEIGVHMAEGVAPFYGTREIGILGQDVSLWIIMGITVLIGLVLLYFAQRKLEKQMSK